MRKQRNNTDNPICPNCLCNQSDKEQLVSHRRDCSHNKPLRLNFLEPDDKIKFKPADYCKTEKYPFVAVADLESLLVPCSEKKGNSEIFQKHVNSSAAAVLIDTDSNVVCSTLARSNAQQTGAATLLRTLCGWAVDIVEKSISEKMQMTAADWNTYQTTTQCCICHVPFTNYDKPVLDHDHVYVVVCGKTANSDSAKYRKQATRPAEVLASTTRCLKRGRATVHLG